MNRANFMFFVSHEVKILSKKKEEFPWFSVQCVSLSVLYSNFLWLPFVLLWLWKITAPTPSRQSLSRLSRTWLSRGLLFFYLHDCYGGPALENCLAWLLSTKVWPQHCQPSEGECTIMDLRLTLPGKRYALRSHQVPFAGTFPGKRDFPRQSHSVDARRDFSRWSHQTCWVRGRKSDLSWARNWYRAAVFIKCAHARIVVARWPNAQPVRTAETTQPWLSPESGGIRW